jgi:hypothetical protein
MEHAAELAEEKAREIISIDNGADEFSVKMRRLFKDKAPTKEEIASIEKNSKKGLNPVKIIAILIGLGIVAGGIIIGHLYGYIAAAIGAVIAILPLFIGKNTAKSKELLAFIRKYTDDDEGGVQECLNKIKTNLEIYDSFSKARASKRESLEDERSALTVKACSFLEKFPTVHADTPLASIRNIKHKYSQYYAL